MNVSVIICAAGKGERAGFKKNKLLVPFHGATALYYTVNAFFEYARIAEEKALPDRVTQILVTSSKEDEEDIDGLCKRFGCGIVMGGNTRFESVFNALKKADGDLILIHDGARPFVTYDIISACIECAKNCGSAVCAMPAVDTTVIAKDGYVDEVPRRADVFCVQTPQCFIAGQIKSAYEKAAGDGYCYTDDGSVYSRYISPAKICACGTPENKKLTHGRDFECTPTPTALVADEKAAGGRVGFGVDVHAFKEGDGIVLCGVRIPCDCAFIAHSDGDVALHAVMDALLSAAGLEDIGHYFPDNDEAFCGIDSTTLLKEVLTLIEAEGFCPVNISVAIQAEKPRIAPHTDNMKATLAAILKIPKSSIGITAGTCEGLGFVGQKFGVTASCCALLKRK